MTAVGTALFASSWRTRTLAAAAAVTIGLLGVSRFNPALAIGVENRLESACSGPEASHYERRSWTPLRWTCVVTRFDGTTDVIGPFASP